MTKPEMKTAYEWNRDQRMCIRVVSWSDFGSEACKDGYNKDSLMTIQEFRRIRKASGCTVEFLTPYDQLTEDD